MLKVIVSSRFAKAVMTGAFRRASHHSINKKVSKIEIVYGMQILQSAVKINYCSCPVQSKPEIF